MVLWCTFRFICNCTIQDIQACHFSEHSSTYQLQQEAPHNNISFNATEDIWHEALDKRTCTSCVYMLNGVYFSPEINIVKQGGRRDGLQCLSIKFPGHAEAIMKWIYIIATVSIKVATRIIWCPLPIKLLVQDLRGIAPLSNMFWPIALPVGSAWYIFCNHPMWHILVALFTDGLFLRCSADRGPIKPPS